MKKILIPACALLLASLLPGVNQAQAQTASPVGEQPAVERALAQATPASADSGTSPRGFDDWVRDFQDRIGQQIGVPIDGRTFFSGVANVSVGPQDPSYGKQLVIAYEKAVLDMQAGFVRQIYGDLITRRVLEVFRDGSSNAASFDPVELRRAQEQGRVGSLIDKALTLADRRLDQELIKAGVPRERVASMTVEQKKTVFRDSLTRDSMIEAVRSMRGLVPVQTRIFTVSTPNGKASRVGVIAVQSPKTQQFALDIARQQPTLVRGEPRRLAQVLPGSDTEYLNEIGLRFIYDEKGLPMLISYGRWSLAVLKDWSPARLLTEMDIAARQARLLAEAAIVEFTSTTVQLQEEGSVGGLSEEVARKITRIDDGEAKGYELQREQIVESIDRFKSTARSNARGSLRGTSVVKRWEQTDDNGVLHVGTVVTWTYAQLDNARAIDQKPTTASGAPAAPQGRAGADESRDSRPINRLKDF